MCRYLPARSACPDSQDSDVTDDEPVCQKAGCKGCVLKAYARSHSGQHARQPATSPAVAAAMAAEVVRGSQRELRSGGRALDRELLALRREEAKLVTDIKAAAKRGDQASAKVLARSLVRLRAQITKLQASAANLRGVATNLTVRQHSTTLHVADVAHHHRLAWCGSNSGCSEPPARLLAGTPPSLPPPLRRPADGCSSDHGRVFNGNSHRRHGPHAGAAQPSTHRTDGTGVCA